MAEGLSLKLPTGERLTRVARSHADRGCLPQVRCCIRQLRNGVREAAPRPLEVVGCLVSRMIERR